MTTESKISTYAEDMERLDDILSVSSCETRSAVVITTPRGEVIKVLSDELIRAVTNAQNAS